MNYSLELTLQSNTHTQWERRYPGAERRRNTSNRASTVSRCSSSSSFSPSRKSCTHICTHKLTCAQSYRLSLGQSHSTRPRRSICPNVNTQKFCAWHFLDLVFDCVSRTAAWRMSWTRKTGPVWASKTSLHMQSYWVITRGLHNARRVNCWPISWCAMQSGRKNWSVLWPIAFFGFARFLFWSPRNRLVVFVDRCFWFVYEAISSTI